MKAGAVASASGASGPVFVPAGLTYGHVMDAITKLQATGKPGTIQLDPDLYDLTAEGQGLPYLSGVTLAGSSYQLNTGQSLVGGTIIQGNGTFDLISANAADLAVPPANLPAMLSTGVRNAHIRDLALKGGRNGIKVGALYQGGAYQSSIRRIRIESCTEWGMHVENWQYSHMSEIDIAPSAGQKGVGRIVGSVPATIFNHGNLFISDLFSEGGDRYTRGWCFHARGATTSSFNDIFVADLQRNCSGSKLTVAATMANGNPEITVPDSSLFPVDLPVTVSASVNGFTRWATYFVIVSGANKVQLANQMGGVAVVPNGATAVNLITWGWAGLEIVGYGVTGSNGSDIQPSTFSGLDIEGKGTNMVVLQNANVHVGIGTAFNTQDTDLATTVCARSVFGGTINSSGTVSTDFDSGSAGALWATGLRRRTDQTNPGYMPQGLVRTETGRMGLNLGTIPNGGVDIALEALNISGRAFMYPHNPIGQRVATFTALTGGLAGQEAGAYAFVGTANSVRTLPTLSGAAGATNTYNGVVYELANCSTTPGVTLTINTAAGQPFNRQTGKTSMVLAIGQSISVRAQTVNGAEWFWQVVGNNGVTI